MYPVVYFTWLILFHINMDVHLLSNECKCVFVKLNIAMAKWPYGALIRFMFTVYNGCRACTNLMLGCSVVATSVIIQNCK